MVESLPSKQVVAGPNPVARSSLKAKLFNNIPRPGPRGGEYYFLSFPRIDHLHAARQKIRDVAGGDNQVILKRSGNDE
jgi:hypothetical protein